MADVVFTHEVHIRNGRLINDDPQRRCYDGCYFKSHMEWGKWEHFQDCVSEDVAKLVVKSFEREDQQLKVVPKFCLN